MNILNLFSDFAKELGEIVGNFENAMRKEVEKSTSLKSQAEKRSVWQKMFGDATNFLETLPKGKLKQHLAKQKFTDYLVESKINELKIINEDNISDIVNKFRSEALLLMTKYVRMYEMLQKEKEDEKSPVDLTSDEDIENAYNKQSSSSASKEEPSKEEPSKEEPPADVKAPASKTSQKSTSDSEVKGVRPISNEEEELVDEENEALEELATFPKDIKEKIIEILLNNKFLNFNGNVNVPTKKITDEELELIEDDTSHLVLLILKIAQEQKENLEKNNILEKIFLKYSSFINEISKRKQVDPTEAPKASSEPDKAKATFEPADKKEPVKSPQKDNMGIEKPNLPESVKTAEDFRDWMGDLSKKIYSKNKEIGEIARRIYNSAKKTIDSGSQNLINPNEQFDLFINLSLELISKNDLYKLIRSTSGFN